MSPPQKRAEQDASDRKDKDGQIRSAAGRGMVPTYCDRAAAERNQHNEGQGRPRLVFDSTSACAMDFRFCNVLCSMQCLMQHMLCSRCECPPLVVCISTGHSYVEWLLSCTFPWIVPRVSGIQVSLHVRRLVVSVGALHVCFLAFGCRIPGISVLLLVFHFRGFLF